MTHSENSVEDRSQWITRCTMANVKYVHAPVVDILHDLMQLGFIGCFHTIQRYSVDINLLVNGVKCLDAGDFGNTRAKTNDI